MDKEMKEFIENIDRYTEEIKSGKISPETAKIFKKGIGLHPELAKEIHEFVKIKDKKKYLHQESVGDSGQDLSIETKRIEEIKPKQRSPENAVDELNPS